MAEEQGNNQLAVTDGAAALPASVEQNVTLPNHDLLDEPITQPASWSSTDLMRQVMLAAVVGIGILMIVVLLIWMQEPRMRPVGCLPD